MKTRTSPEIFRVAVLGTRGIPDVMGGVETHCQALYPRLAARGHKVTLFARSGYVGRKRPYEYGGVRVEPVWTPKSKSMEAVSHTAIGVIKAAARRGEFDLLHIHAIGPSLLAPLARLLGLKVVVTNHGPDYDRKKWGTLARRMLRLGERLGCAYAHRVIGVSRHICGSLRKSYGRAGSYIPNGVTVPETIPAGAYLESLGLKPGRYILAVGRFVPEKGFHDLVAAFGRMKTGWNLVIAGKADHEDEYSRSLVLAASKDHRVVLTGFVKGRALGEVYSNAALFVLPSYHEGLPIVLLEAMSYGLPAIASAIPANLEVLGAEDTFPAGDVAAIEKMLRAFVAAPRSCPGNRERVASNYDWDEVATLTERVYREVLTPETSNP